MPFGKWKSICILLFAVFSLSGFAQNKEMMNFAEDVKLDKKQMEQSIDMLVQSGRISEEQANKAKKKLQNYSEEDLKAIKNQALQKMKDSGGAQNMIPPAGSGNIGASESSSEQKERSSKSQAESTQAEKELKESSSYKKAMEYLNNSH